MDHLRKTILKMYFKIDSQMGKAKEQEKLIKHLKDSMVKKYQETGQHQAIGNRLKEIEKSLNKAKTKQANKSHITVANDIFKKAVYNSSERYQFKEMIERIKTIRETKDLEEIANSI